MNWKELSTKVLLILSSIWVYIPIVAGIVTIMWYLIPTAYISWYIFLSTPTNMWAEMIYVLPPKLYVFKIIFCILIIITGIYLLIRGLIELVIDRKNDINISKNGLYKYIRHPQNLGIILISLFFVLWTQFRVGDFLSWLLFTLIIIIWSDLEEMKLVKTYPEEYTEYRKTTGFFFPRIIEKRKHRSTDWKYYLFRYLIFICIYSIIVVAMYLITQYFPGITVK